MKFIAIGTLKGGVGKTTVAVSLAYELASRGSKCLLLDADPQANSTSYLGLDETVEGYKSIKDIFENRQINPREIVSHTKFENLDVIGSTILLTATEKKLFNTSFAEQQLKKYIARNADFFNKYDYIIADTNPSMSKINQNVFVASNGIVCVSDIGIGSHKGIELFDFLLSELADESELDLKINAILLNKFKLTNKLSKDYKEYLTETTSDILLKNYIRDSVKLAEAELEQMPISAYAPKSQSSIEVKNVVDELIERKVL